MIKFFLILFAVLIFIQGCQRMGVIDEDKFVEIYSDLLIAGDTTSVAEAKDIVFPRYNISEDEYQNTVEYYNNNPEEWETFFNKVIAHIEQKRTASSSVP
jgi:hypothetical protein